LQSVLRRHDCRLAELFSFPDPEDAMEDRPPYFFVPQWPVFYEDNHLLALYKPSGLLIQADQTKDISLLEIAKIWIKQRYCKPGKVFLAMVHRLDRPVAGVVLFCRTSRAAARISGQFQKKKIKKRYVAVVEGVMEKTSGILVHHLERTHTASSRIVPEKTAAAREARLFYRVLDTDHSRSFLSIDLETGRHHQIRAQFAHIGFPLLGDLRYGASAPMPEKQIALFAQSLTVLHPVTGDQLCFTSPLPAGWPWPEFDESGAPVWNWSDLSPVVRLL
jgi:23S rRNA pseudouridine1911/1915/1917 synthase